MEGAHLKSGFKKRVKATIRATLPLPLRKTACILINTQKWLGEDLRHWWTRELLTDFRENDVNAYHQFLWAHHLGYALTYEKSERFGNGNLPESRRIFFSDLVSQLRSMGVDPAKDVRSVLEVGCSLGYQLRFLEMDLFPGASELEGVDIDRYAVEKGMEHLQGEGSKIRLHCGDMADLDRLVQGKFYDVVICTGVLMYLDEQAAFRVVQTMLDHCKLILGLSGPANPEADNQFLRRSVSRPTDGALVHNLDGMVEQGGGRVLARRWEGGRTVEGHTLYFVFASRISSGRS